MVNNALYIAQKIVLENNPAPYYELIYNVAETSYWRDLIAWVYDELKSKDNLVCLDIGAAYGTLLTFCKTVNPSSELIAVDFVKYMSDELIKKIEVNYIFKNFEKDEIELSKKADIILLTEVIEHFNYNPVPTLQKINYLLSEDGSLFLSTPNAIRWRRLDEYNSYVDLPNVHDEITVRDQHIYQYLYEELLEILDKSGFYVVNINERDSNNFNIQAKKKVFVSGAPNE